MSEFPSSKQNAEILPAWGAGGFEHLYTGHGKAEPLPC